MKNNVHAWPNVSGRPREDLPRQIWRPCDAGLMLAIMGLETQLGTIEAYNRLVVAALELKQQIDAGKAKPQNPLFAVRVKG